MPAKAQAFTHPRPGKGAMIQPGGIIVAAWILFFLSLSPLAHAQALPAPRGLTISLEQAITLAKERSFRLGRAERGLEGARARHSAASTAYYPRLDSSLQAAQNARSTVNDGTDGLKPDATLSANFFVTQPIDIAGVIGRQVTQVDLARTNAELDVAVGHLDVELEVRNGYYQALRSQEAIRVDEEIVADLERLVERAKTSIPQALGFLQVELANARQTLNGSRTIFDLTLDSLRQTLRLPPHTELRLTENMRSQPKAPTLEQATRTALESRPELKQFQVRIEQARLSAEQVNDVRKPTLLATASHNNSLANRNLGRAIDSPLSYNRGIGLILNIPLVYFDWGFLTETKRAALLNYEQTQLDLVETQERVALEVRQAYIALQRAEQRIGSLPNIELARDALRRAEEVFFASGADFSAGLAQMSNVRSNLRFSESALVDAYGEYNLAFYRLQRATGVR